MRESPAALITAGASGLNRSPCGGVWRRIFGIPVLTVSYIGALKSYIYFPTFATRCGSGPAPESAVGGPPHLSAGEVSWSTCDRRTGATSRRL